MPTFLTVDLTPNGKALDIKANDLFVFGLTDYRENLLMISAIRNIVLEDELNGFNVNHIDGYKVVLNYQMFTRVGNKIVGSDITNNQQLLDAFVELAAL